MASKGNDSEWLVWGAIGLACILMFFGVPLDSVFKPGEDSGSNESYSREAFGPSWEDVDKNGCDTRNDILQRDLTKTRVDPNGCTVVSGTLNDPYTGKTIQFVRGKDTSAAVQIDHIVPLSYAWKAGASDWDAQKRLQFANDPENLMSVDGPTNGKKSDKGPSQFVPPNKAYVCEYLGKFQAVTQKYSLTITSEDQQFIEKQKC